MIQILFLLQGHKEGYVYIYNNKINNKTIINTIYNDLYDKYGLYCSCKGIISYIYTSSIVPTSICYICISKLLRDLFPDCYIRLNPYNNILCLHTKCRLYLKRNKSIIPIETCLIKTKENIPNLVLNREGD